MNDKDEMEIRLVSGNLMISARGPTEDKRIQELFDQAYSFTKAEIKRKNERDIVLLNLAQQVFGIVQEKFGGEGRTGLFKTYEEYIMAFKDIIDSGCRLTVEQIKDGSYEVVVHYDKHMTSATDFNFFNVMNKIDKAVAEFFDQEGLK